MLVSVCLAVSKEERKLGTYTETHVSMLWGGNKKSGCLWDDVFYVLHGSLKEIVNSRLEKEASSSE